MKTAFINIRALVQIRPPGTEYVSGKDMRELPVLENAYLLVDDNRISGFGTMDRWKDPGDTVTVDCTGKFILPAWVDSHTHIVYAGNREEEFADKIKGLSYEEIAARGGGILQSVIRLRKTSEEQLFAESSRRLEAMMQMGTGTVEIKSGYGLDLESEMKMLRVIRRLNTSYPATVKATFLGAHAVPPDFGGDTEAYTDYIVEEMMPEIAREGLADFVDVFCEKNYFNTQQTKRIIEKAKIFGIESKIHVNQFHSTGGVPLAVDSGARSIDHLEVLTGSDLSAMKNSAGHTMPVALPGCSFFLGIPYTPARKIIDSGLPLAIATDYNPGSAPSGNMNFALSLASIKMKMTPEEGINAATINAAYAMDSHQETGSITIGKKANIIITEKIPSYTYLSYSFGENHIESVYLEGKKIK